MTDSPRPQNAAHLPEVSPDGLGNTIDGSAAGDGAITRRSDEADSAAGAPDSTTVTGTDGGHAARREEQKKVYRSPEQPDHAVGGSDGTTDGQ